MIEQITPFPLGEFILNLLSINNFDNKLMDLIIIDSSGYLITNF